MGSKLLGYRQPISSFITGITVTCIWLLHYTLFVDIVLKFIVQFFQIMWEKLAYQCPTVYK